MPSYKHAGDGGDIVISLPVIRYHGSGILYLEDAPYTRQRMTWENAKPLIPLLKTIPYIEDVRPWNGEQVDINLNDFRSKMFRALRTDIKRARKVGLWQWYSITHAVPSSEWDRPWFDLPIYKPSFPVVLVNRTARYNNVRFPWRRVIDKYREIIFVGLPEEAEALGFTEDWKAPKHYRRTPDVLEVAKALQHFALFIGNQSMCHAIAKGMGKPFVLECYKEMPNCVYNSKPNEHYGWDENVFLPDLKDLP